MLNMGCKATFTQFIYPFTGSRKRVRLMYNGLREKSCSQHLSMMSHYFKRDEIDIHCRIRCTFHLSFIYTDKQKFTV